MLIDLYLLLDIFSNPKIKTGKDGGIIVFFPQCELSKQDIS